MYKRLFSLLPLLALIFLANKCDSNSKAMKYLTTTTWKESSENTPQEVTYLRNETFKFQPLRGIRTSYKLNTDNTIVMEYSGSNDAPQLSKGTWKLDENILTMTFDNDDSELAGKTLTYEVLETSPALIKIKRK